MNPDSHKNPDGHTDSDSYQQAWQALSSQTRVTIDADLLLQEVQRNQRDFQAIILRRDFGEVALGLTLLPVWFYLGITQSLPWTWYLTVPVLVWVVGFVLVNRMRHKQDCVKPDEPLLHCVQRSLIEVENQIWLAHNVFWWYILPFAISILAFTFHVAWLRSRYWSDTLDDVNSIVFVVFLAMFYFLYYMNQVAVRWQLEPRRQELLKLLASLGDESTSVSASAMLASRPKTQLRWLVVAGLCISAILFFPLLGGITESSYDGPLRSSGPAGDWLANSITDQCNEKDLVGLAAMVIVDGQFEAGAAYGERKVGSEVPLEITDRWHLGGITKSVTATMIARLIESGQMKWTDTVGESFPDAQVHEQWKPVTLKQLLTHTAGAQKYFSLAVRRIQPPLGPESTEARREAVLGVIARKPEHTPGTRYAYSGVGYTIAGAMAEKATGVNWEDLLRREVFEPLELDEAGFGPPKSGDETLEQPRGHRTRLAGKFAVDDKYDNTTIVGPAGIVHMSLRDLCSYTGEHLRGELGEGKLLDAETYQLLHMPELSHYACGWVEMKPTYDIPYTAYWHNGANTAWYALTVFIPEKNMVVAVTSNDGDIEQAEAAAWEIVKACAKQFNNESDAERRKLLLNGAFPKKSPFAAVRWSDSEPEVKLDEEWFKLVSLDGLPIAEILTFSHETFENKWQMRFEEDLVELLTRMGYPPQDTVKLVVQSLTTSETQVLEGIPMTEANRWAIKKAANARATSQPRN